MTAVSTRLTLSRIRVVCLARVLLFATFMTVAASIPLLVEDWGLSAAAAGAIVSSFTICYAASLFGFAWASDHLGAKRMVMVSAVAAAVASAVFGLLAHDWLSAMLLYGLVGLTQGGVYTPLVMVFADEVEGTRRGDAMGWLIASTSLGYAGSLAAAGIGIALGGWPAAFVLCGLLPTAGAVILIAALLPLPNRIHPRPRGVRVRDEIARNREARLLIVGYTGHAWELLGMWAWFPAFLAAGFAFTGGDTAEATVSGAYLSGGLHLFGALAAYSRGRLSDRTGRRPVLIALAGAGAAASFLVGWLVYAPSAILVPLALVYTFVCVGDSPVLTTAISEAARPGYLGAVLAWRGFAGFAAGALAPLAAGAAYDAVNAVGAGAPAAWGAAFMVLGLGGATALACALRLRRAG